MMRTVQLVMADAGYTAALREALSRSGSWRVQPVDHPDLDLPSVVVVDEWAFAQLPLPLAHPERVVLITRQEREALAHAWDAGIVSVVSTDDPLPTVLLAIMAAALRITPPHGVAVPGGISPKTVGTSAPIGPNNKSSRSKSLKIH
jgi:hypothetical protein